MDSDNHRIIGRELKLFMFHEFSPGSCFFLPHGAKLYNNLLNFLRHCYDKLGYKEVMTPNIFNKQLWIMSGHWEKYKENMFVIKSDDPDPKTDDPDSKTDDEEFSLKPMNCPGHCLMAQQMIQSYNDLPLRLADFGVLHRNELSGTLTGLTRVRRFQQDDAHIFCTLDQVSEEIHNYIDFLKRVYEHFGLALYPELSTRPDVYIGSLDNWERAETILGEEIKRFPNWQVNRGMGHFMDQR